MVRKILIVDDSTTVRQQVGLVLTQAGYEVVEAADGQEAVTKVTGTPDLSLVVCDVNMPVMDGLEFLETIKREPKHADLPVLMLTTEGQPAQMQRAKKAGAKGWMVKPFVPDLLLAAANKLAR